MDGFIEKSIQKSECLTFMDNGRLRIGIDIGSFDVKIGKSSRRIFGKSKMKYGKEDLLATFNKNTSDLIISSRQDGEMERISLQRSNYSYDKDPYVLKIELSHDPMKRKTKNHSIHLKFKEMNTLSLFELILVEKLECKFVSRNENPNDSESIVCQKLRDIGLSGKEFDPRVLYDPDFIRHHFLSVYSLGIKYDCDEGWRESNYREKDTIFQVIFSEINHDKTSQQLLEEIINPIQTHDYLGSSISESLNVSCSVILGPFYLNFTKYGFIVPRRYTHYPCGGNIYRTIHLSNSRLKTSIFKVLPSLISEYNTKFKYSPESNESNVSQENEETEGEEELHNRISIELEKRTSVDFTKDLIDRILETFGSTYPSPNSILNGLFEKIRNEGYIHELSLSLDQETKNVITDPQYNIVSCPELGNKLFSDPKEPNKIIFHTHLILDQFAERFLGIDGLGDFYPEISQIIRSFDRIFWCKHLLFEDDRRWKPKEKELDAPEYVMSGCPLNHPFRYWKGYVSDEYLGKK